VRDEVDPSTPSASVLSALLLVAVEALRFEDKLAVLEFRVAKVSVVDEEVRSRTTLIELLLDCVVAAVI
jgi:hypothetical protein